MLFEVGLLRKRLFAHVTGIGPYTVVCILVIFKQGRVIRSECTLVVHAYKLGRAPVHLCLVLGQIALPCGRIPALIALKLPFIAMGTHVPVKFDLAAGNFVRAYKLAPNTCAVARFGMRFKIVCRNILAAFRTFHHGRIANVRVSRIVRLARRAVIQSP